MDLGNSTNFQEWKACRDSLGNLDKILVDLRKFGFGLITIVLSANGFLFSEQDLGIFAIIAIYIALLVLIFGLFRFDRVHEIFIRSTVLRAMRLEALILSESSCHDGQDRGMGLTWEISYWSEKLNTGTWGHHLYRFFCFAAYVLAVGGIIDSAGDDIWTKGISIILAFVIYVVASKYILRQHEEAGDLKEVFKRKVNERTRAFGYSDLE